MESHCHCGISHKHLRHVLWLEEQPNLNQKPSSEVNKVRLAKPTPGLACTDLYFPESTNFLQKMPKKTFFERSYQVFLQRDGYLPLLVKGAAKDDVLLHGGIEQPRLLSCVSHGVPVPTADRHRALVRNKALTLGNSR